MQKMLNAAGFTVSVSGAGSPGMETTIFGNATLKAVKAFQKAKGLTADGIFGSKSRAKLMGM